MVSIFDKQHNCQQAFNYTTIAGIHEERKVPSGSIDIGMYGSVWNYSYMAWWIHQRTSLQIESFVEKTNSLSINQIPADTYYSIGCVYFDKEFWLSMNPKQYKSIIDEVLMHEYCKKLGKEKWTVMNEPIVHLFIVHIARLMHTYSGNYFRHYLLILMTRHF
ncbi:MAG: hypothetical protein C4329_03900 [Chitinophagaceae bacterium]